MFQPGDLIRVVNTDHIRYPDVDDMLKAGMPLHAAFAMWSRMMSEQDRPPSFWWERIKTWRPSTPQLQ